MTPEPPAELPNLVTVVLRRLAGPGASRPDRQPGASRDHVHRLVDQLIDVGATLSSLVRPANATIRETVRSSARAVAGTPPTGGAAADPGMRVLPLGPVAAGLKAAGELTVSNDGRDPLAGLTLSCPALVSETGARIAGENLSVAPNPMDLAPRSTRIVDVSVSVPTDATPGAYAGVLSAVGIPEIRTLVILEVA